jgi:hypothetical protein
MPALDAAPLVASHAVRGSEIETVERWVEERRRELARLTAELRAAQAEAAAAEMELSRMQAPAGRVAASVEHSAPTQMIPMVDAVLTQAKDRFVAEIEAARSDAAEVVAGAMRKASTLFDAVERDLARLPAARPPAVDVVHHPLTDLTDSPHAVVDLTESDDAVLGRDVSPEDSADLYAAFWADLEADQPVRERLRRWVQRP